MRLTFLSQKRHTSAMAQHERILILDFGSQVTQLIARRVREANVYCEIKPCTMSEADIRAFNPKGIILSGGPASVHEGASPTVTRAVFEMGVPVLGICYGQQLMCHLLGGQVVAAGHREFGRAQIDIVADSALFNDIWRLGQAAEVWMSHSDRVERLPVGFKVIASTPSAPFAAIADETRRLYGTQFHLEVVHTPQGATILKRFVQAVCGCQGDWTMEAFKREEMDVIRTKVGAGKVICGVSGGVDSSVVATLLHQAIGDQLVCIFVDNGLLRYKEAEQVRAMFVHDLKVPLTYVDASRIFLARLQGVRDPERKRKIIGETFIEVFDEEAARAGDAEFLAQGTLYPDVIESLSSHGGPSVTIKSHHNVGGLPEHMKLKLIEPVRELFKDEVRALGRTLGMSDAMIGRHPFPGPGLAIRVPGEVTEERLNILRQADAIYIDEIRKAGLYDIIWQAFAVLLPVRSVGVMGDARTYEFVCALRAVTSTDGMTADYYGFDHGFLSGVAGRIINEVRGINRVVYDITSKPPGTIEWE